MISARFDGFVCDMDGVLYRGSVPVPGALETVDRLRSEGKRFLFCTNNSVPTVSQYVAKLRGMGLDIEPGELLTSATVTGETLAARGARGKKAYVVGGDGLREELERVGIELVDGERPDEVDIVAVGSDHSFDYHQMRVAANAARAGAVLIASNADPSYPTPDGIAPGAGAILASIEVASGVTAEVVGKPHPPMMEAAARRLVGCTSIAAIGDQPKTDLEGARSQGWATILVLSGVISTQEEAEALLPLPDYILSSISEVTRFPDPPRCK